jgi:hypothetical protein
MADESKALVVQSTNGELVKASGADDLLRLIRPEWQAKDLISRVKRLLPVDPSSACQRILNAAIHDLRKKIVTAGLDVAKEAASRFSLPSVAKIEDILESYSTAHVIDLAYRMGLLSRPEWRRVRRAYDIRRDLEHEDEDYEAGGEDILYVFKASIEAVLSKEPVELLRISDVKEVVNSDEPASPTAQFLKDYQSAPEPRQFEIAAFLVTTAVSSKNADIVRQNAVELLTSFEPFTKQQVKIDLGKLIQERFNNKGRLELVVGKVAAAAGVLRYLKQRDVAQLCEFLVKRLEDVGYHWKEFNQHGRFLDDIEDIGGLLVCPPEIRARLVRWMTLCYLGEPGEYGEWGRNRKVFYSDSAARRIERMLSAAGAMVKDDLESALNDKHARAAVSNRYIARRAETLRDLVVPAEE